MPMYFGAAFIHTDSARKDVYMPEIQIEAFTSTSLVVTAAICLVAVLAAWYTVRDRVQLSQIILGVFCYVLVMVLENVFDTLAAMAGIGQSGAAHGLYIILSVVAARELIRFAGLRYGVLGNFDTTDSAVGFAIGFAGVYLCVCGVYYFNCYSTASEFIKSGAESFWINAGADSEEARQLLETISAQSGWQFIFTAINRVFFLVRELALTVLLWYAMTKQDKKLYYGLVPLMHLLAMLPDGLFQAGILTNTYGRDILICLISAGIAFLAAREYNVHEDQVSHFRVEKLRTRRKK